ncbi:MAG: hypothetical protein ACE5GB_06250 [Acidimicrobiales bacterium]
MSARWTRRLVQRNVGGAADTATPVIDTADASSPASLLALARSGLEVSADDTRLVLSTFVTDEDGLSVHPGPVTTVDRHVSDQYLGLVISGALGLVGRDDTPPTDQIGEIQRALRVRSRRALVERRPRVTIQSDRAGNLVVNPLRPDASRRDWDLAGGHEVVLEPEVPVEAMARVVREALVTAHRLLG